MPSNGIERNIENILDEQKDEMIYRLSEEGFESFIDTDSGFKAYIPLEGFLIQKFEPIFQEFRQPYTFMTIADQNWNEEWEKNYLPVLIGDRCYIHAPFHPPFPEIQYDIIIEPKMSFGTAHHETTALMIEMILETDCNGKRVLDMGCGTGILAILARKTGAVSVMAIDNDVWSYRNTQENIVKNNIDGIDVVLGDVNNLKNIHVDLVFANINRNVLLEQIPYYSDILDTGDLIISGFYESDLGKIKLRTEENGFRLLNYKINNNWMVAKFKK